MKEHCHVVVGVCVRMMMRKGKKNMFTTVDSSFIKSLPRVYHTDCEKSFAAKEVPRTMERKVVIKLK